MVDWEARRVATAQEVATYPVGDYNEAD